MDFAYTLTAYNCTLILEPFLLVEEGQTAEILRSPGTTLQSLVILRDNVLGFPLVWCANRQQVFKFLITFMASVVHVCHGDLLSCFPPCAGWPSLLHCSDLARP